MPCLHIPKKLKKLPSSSKKAWKSFTSSLHNHLKIPNSVTRTARHVLHLRPRMGGAHGGLSYNRKQAYYQYRNLQQWSSATASPATVYVDRLYGESSKTRTTAHTSARANDDRNGIEEVAEKRRRERESVGNKEMKDVRWKEYISSLPKIRGVDERADEFISEFRQQMQLQRQHSILEFQQMLARST